jgi:hypothetical protein
MTDSSMMSYVMQLQTFHLDQNICRLCTANLVVADVTC